GLVLTEVELPDLVRTRRWRGERGLALLGQFPALFLVVSMEQEAFVGHDPQHRRRRKPVPVVTDHGPDLAMAPGGMLARHGHLSGSPWVCSRLASAASGVVGAVWW